MQNDMGKKTINKTLVIGAELTATVILAPTTFARDHHEPATNGIQLATDIVELVRAVIEPRPAPVIVETTPQVVEKTVIVEKTPTVVTTTEKTVIVTGAEEIVIPEYEYVVYEDEYIPYYEGWIFIEDDWYWAGKEPRPDKPPRWTPPKDRKPEHHKVVARVERRPGHGPGYGPEPDFHREERRPEPTRTVVVRPERKEVVVRPERKEKVTVKPDRRLDAPPKKGR